MIKACVFDCDGTLLDTLWSIGNSANLALQDLGYEAIPMEEYKRFVGDGAKVLIERMCRRVGDEDCSRYEELSERYFVHFRTGCSDRVLPYDGIMPLLAALKKRDIRITVFSNKPHAQTEKVIADAFGEGYCDAVQGQVEGIPKKPAPDGALLIAEKLGVSTQECLYIGDTDTDMQTGRAAGMHTVGVLWGFRDREELEANGAEHIIEHPMELLRLTDLQ